MKTIKFLSMAALALVGAVMTGCSSDDSIIDEQPANKSKVVTLTTTVGFGEGATTRALAIDFDGKKAEKTFAAGETMAVIYKNNDNETVKAVSAALPDGDYGKSATFTFELEDPDKTKPVMYIYPAAMAKATIATDATIDEANTVDFTNLDAQNGTLSTLSSSLDLATYSNDWNGTSLPTGTLVNQLAVCALTLKDNATPTANTITSGLTEVTVSDGSNTYTVTPTGSTFGEDVIYVAIRPVTAALQYTATDGTTNYMKTATSREYAAGNFYNLGLRMELPAVTYTAPTIRSGSSTYSGSAQNLYGTAGSATGGTMYYSYRYHTIGTSTFGDWSGWSTSAPTGTNAGVYDVRYKVEPNAGYSGGVDATEIGSFTINKANGWCSLNPNSGRDFGTLKSGDYRVIVTHHGGSLSCSKSGNNSSNVTASVSSSTQVRIYKENSFNDGSGVTVTVTSAATTNYNAASAQFTCNQ